MKPAYRIVTIKLRGYENRHKMFEEQEILLYTSLRDLGYNVDCAYNEFAQDRTNIVLGWNFLRYSEMEKLIGNKLIRYIPWQLEQIQACEADGMAEFRTENWIPILKNAYQIWDYSKENIKWLKDKGIDAKYLPLGYHKCLEWDLPEVEKDIDILFYGAPSERRVKIMNDLGDKLTYVQSELYGEDKYKYINRAKIVLSVSNFEEHALFEQTRLTPLWCNRVFTISETFKTNPYPGVFSVHRSYEEIVETCKWYLHYPYLKVYGKDNYNRFKLNYDMRELLKEVL